MRRVDFILGSLSVFPQCTLQTVGYTCLSFLPTCGHRNHFLSDVSSHALPVVNTLTAYTEIQYRPNLPTFILKVSFNVIQQLKARRGGQQYVSDKFHSQFSHQCPQRALLSLF